MSDTFLFDIPVLLLPYIIQYTSKYQSLISVSKSSFIAEAARRLVSGGRAGSRSGATRPVSTLDSAGRAASPGPKGATPAVRTGDTERTCHGNGCGIAAAARALRPQRRETPKSWSSCFTVRPRSHAEVCTTCFCSPNPNSQHPRYFHNQRFCSD